MGLKTLNERSWQRQRPDASLCLRLGDDPMPVDLLCLATDKDHPMHQVDVPTLKHKQLARA